MAQLQIVNARALFQGVVQRSRRAGHIRLSPKTSGLRRPAKWTGLQI
jgi:hypothetical protein